MSWLPGVSSPAEATRLLCPDAAARADDLLRALDGPTGLEPDLVELIRSRVRHLLRVPGATFDHRTARTERERAALAFGEQYVLDPSGITDDDAVAWHELFTEPELTALTFTVAVHDALARVELVLSDASNEATP
jgi:alkylhydroperoxidase family enzyme